MRVAAAIGSPIGHSLSPAIHNAAFATLPDDWRYVTFDVPPGGAAAALDAMRALGLVGLSVTTPHKQAVADAVDRVDPPAQALRSVNTVAVDEHGGLVGYSTDGNGFVDALVVAGVDPAGARVAVVGAGGAARSVIDALGRHGASEIVVVNRTPTHAASAVELARTARIGAMGDVTVCDIVVNATTVGMGDRDDATPIDARLLQPAHIVADLVYHPLRTRLLRDAAAAGARTIDGLGMLVHQAVRAQELWTGHRPDPGPMRAAAEDELARRRQQAAGMVPPDVAIPDRR